MSSFLDTLLADAETIVESDLPSPEAVRGVLAALVKRVEQLAGIGHTQAPPPPPTPEPAPTNPVPADAAPADTPDPAAASGPGHPPVQQTDPAPTAAELDQQIAELQAQRAALGAPA